MATLVFGALTGGQSYAFNPSTDILQFDGTAAAQLRVSGSSSAVISAVKTITLLTPLATLCGANVHFTDGSVLKVGGNTPSTANDDLANSLLGTSFKDALFGLGGDDTLNGAAGDDYLDGGAGADSLLGGLGNDLVLFDLADLFVNGGGGTDTLYVADASLDLTPLAGVQLLGFELVKLAHATGSLELRAADVVALSETDTLRVWGSAGDSVSSTDLWIQAGTTTIGGDAYAKYVNGAATLVVDTDIDRSGLRPVLDISSLDGTNGFMLAGAAAGDGLGSSVSRAGDVNGDGFEDLLLGAPFVDTSATYGAYTFPRPDAGASYVVFGSGSGFASTIDLSGDIDGVKIYGRANDDHLGTAVAAAGDWNADGIDDFAIGSPGATAQGLGSGHVVVIYGDDSFGPTFDIYPLLASSIGGRGLSGHAAGEGAGASTGAALDVDRDGFLDLIVGSPAADVGGTDAGSASVYLPGAHPLGTTGLEWRIYGAAAGDRAGASVSGAGDMNGDGYADLVVGAPGAGTGSGSAYVLFGKGAFTSNLQLSALGASDGFVLAGVTAGDLAGCSVSSAGDFNGDGFADLVIGARGASAYAGAAYVVFGRASGLSSVQLSALDGANGLRLFCGAAAAEFGSSVSGAGDVNGDGFDDLIIGAPAQDASAGAAYLLFGQAGGFASAIDVTAWTGIQGFEIAGAAAGDRLGHAVSSAGDLDADGFGDILIGAPGSDPGGAGSGAVYVVYGRDFTAQVDAFGTAGANSIVAAAGEQILMGGGAKDTIKGGGGADVLRGQAGDDTLLYDGADRLVDGGTGIDVLRFAGGGDVLDFTAPGDERIHGIECIDLTGTGANTIVLSPPDVRELSDTTDTLRVDGNRGDVVHAGPGWILGGTVTAGGQSYVQYTQGAATLEVDIDVTRDVGFALPVTNLAPLEGGAGFRLVSSGFTIGYLPQAAGDINGDGFMDLVVATPHDVHFGVGNHYSHSYEASTVLYGKAGGFASAIDVSTLAPDQGFRLSTGLAYDNWAVTPSLGSAGDVNGDGFDDLLIGLPHIISGQAQAAGATYVVFGKAGTFDADIHLTALDGSAGFRISGEAQLDYAGDAHAAGDVNGDGFDDIVIAALGADPHGSFSGADYVVFGKASGFASNLDVTALDGLNGFRLSGGAANDRAAVVGHGDVNGDGFADLVVGALYADAGGADSGACYVVFGKPGGFASNIELTGLNGSDGFAISGAAGEQLGRYVSVADLNGDGFDDVVAASQDSACVMFGAANGFAATVEAGTLDAVGGLWFSKAGDVNCDGYDDFVSGGRVLFGGPQGIAAADLAGRGAMQGYTFEILSGALGDLTGDGFVDFGVGMSDYYGLTGSGVYFGRDFGETLADAHEGSAGADTMTGGKAADTLTGAQGADSLAGGGGKDVLVGGQGNDKLDGGSAADILRGGTGDDIYTVDNAGDRVVEDTAAGHDVVKSAVTFVLPVNTEELVLTGQGAISGTGNLLANVITGNAAANVLSGGTGDDRLIGKGGGDTLSGGAGADAFVFDTALGAGNVDTILDFTSGLDKIRVDDDVFAALGPVTKATPLAGGSLVNGTAGAEADDFLIYDGATGSLYYDANGNGGPKVLIAILGTSSHPASLAASDFLVVP